MIKNNDEFLKIALHSYDNPILSSLDDFEKDLRRFSLLNTALHRFSLSEDSIRLRKSLNHIVILSNCFGIKNIADMIRFKIDKENSELVETLMYFLKITKITMTPINFNILNRLEML